MVTPTSATSEAGESYEDAPPAPAAPAGPSRRGPSRASISINNLPPEWKDLLGNFLDKDGDGRINTAEFADAGKMFAAAQANEKGEIPIEALPKELQASLRAFDVDGDGNIAPMELARGAELYTKSKNKVKQLTRLAVALMLLMSLMLAAITGLTFVVVELSKETHTGSDGKMTVAGSNRSVATDAADHTYAHSGGGALATDLLRMAELGNGDLTALKDLEIVVNGKQINVMITSYEYTFRIPLIKIDEDLDADDLNAYDLVGEGCVPRAGQYDATLDVLALSTSSPRTPVVAAIALTPVGAAPVPSTIVLNAEQAEGLYALMDCDVEATRKNRKLLWGWLRNALNAAEDSIAHFTSQVAELTTAIADKVQELNDLRIELQENVLNNVQDLIDTIRDTIENVIEPFLSLTGCDIVEAIEGGVNTFLEESQLCIEPDCPGVPINQDEPQDLFEGDLDWADVDGTISAEHQTNANICFGLVDLELDCSNLEAGMSDFWADNPLSDIMDEVTTALPFLEDVANAVSSLVGGRKSRRRLLGMNDTAMTVEEESLLLLTLDGSSLSDLAPDDLIRLDSGHVVRRSMISLESYHNHARQGARAAVAGRLERWARERRLNEDPNNALIQLSGLHARVTLNFDTLITAEAQQRFRNNKDLLEGTGADEVRFDFSLAVPGTLGLISFNVEAGVELRMPLDVEVTGALEGSMDLRMHEMYFEVNLVDGEFTYSTGDYSGSEMRLSGVAGMNIGVMLTGKVFAAVKACLIGMCAGVGVEAKMQAGAGADMAITTTTGNFADEFRFETAKTDFAEYTVAQVAAYDDAYAQARGGLLWAGGVWAYVTAPTVKVFPILEGGMLFCDAVLDPWFEFVAEENMNDSLDENSPSVHKSFGAFLARTAFSWASPFPGKAGDEMVAPINIPTITNE